MTQGSGRPVGGRAAPTVHIEVPGAVRELVAKLEEAGFETWAVGGGVRDAVWGKRRAPEDWDLATRATPDEVRGLFRRTVPLGERHGTIGVFGTDNRLYEVTTFRRDVSTDGRRAVVDGDASENICNIARTVSVYLGGREVVRKRRLEVLAN